MKKNITLLLTFIITLSYAQIPAGYYDSATGTGYTLKTQLFQIINGTNDGLATEYTMTNHSGSSSYNDLYTAYQTTDTDNLAIYENDGTVLDMYSENPSGTDPYNFTHFSDECGNYSNESDCYNREHLYPQGYFNKKYPMRADVHFVVPSDGKVNGNRSNYPFGEVTNPSWTSQNGSKRGPNTFPGYSGTVFEPIDEFKGDIARMMLYFATRYEDQVTSSGWDDPNATARDPRDGSTDRVYEQWFVNLLISWHNADPVSAREIARNNACFTYQNNRNPFIDHPEWVENIWAGTSDTEAPTAPTSLVASNPTVSTIALNWTAATDNVAVTSYDIYRDNVLAYNTTNTSFTATGLAGDTNYCFTVKAKDLANNVSPASNQSCETTLTGGGSTGTVCTSETFANINTGSASYSTHTWTGDNGLSWTATSTRTDQTINNEAIVLKNGTLTAPTTAGGIGDLTVTTQRKFSGNSGTYDVFVNGSLVGTVPYSTTIQTTTIPGINIENNVTITFSKTSSSSSSDRVAFDDLSWTCYSTTASIAEVNLQKVTIYPNPIEEGQFFIKLYDPSTLIIYSVLGKEVMKKTLNSGVQTVDVNTIKRGIYLVKIITENGMTVKKIKIE
jgi:endonuclease I/chitodextrinase